MTHAVLLTLAALGGAAGVVGRFAAYRLAQSVRQGRAFRAWRVACLAATLLYWGVLLLVLELLDLLALTHWYGTRVGNLIGAIVIAAAVPAFGVARFQRGMGPYWKVAHDSLERAIPPDSEQGRIFNQDHVILLKGGSTAETALHRIINARA